MSNHPAQTANGANDRVKVILAVVASIAGIIGFYFFSDKPALIRAGILVAGLLIGAGFAWFSSSGRNFLVFARESVRETKKVVWPSRNDTLRVTAIVFGFVLIMAVFLWGADNVLEFVLYDLILGWKK